MNLSDLKVVANKALPSSNPIAGLKIGDKMLIFDGIIEVHDIAFSKQFIQC